MLNKFNQKLSLVILLFFFGIICFIGSYFLIKPRVIEITSVQVFKDSVNKNQIAENEKVKIILVGDMMLNRGVEYRIKREGDGNFKFPFLKVAEALEGTDILFGNLEGPISDKGIKVGSIYSFRNNPEAIEGLTFAGFDVISLANNHAFDYGREALEDTFLRLKNAGIDYVGAGFNKGEAYSPVVKEINGMRIGVLAYTNLGPETWKATEINSGIAWISERDFEKIKKDIKNAKSQADILIVSLHSGEEYQKEPTRFQIDFAKMAIDAGADLVVGHHPHVTQKNETYNDKYIFYSLGNFVFDQSFSEETMKGQMVKVLIENGKIKRVIPIEIKINEFFQPEIK
jgi:poly-gamma-glutamate synthesis protein (capsule biosynthesis protein)